MKPHLGASLRRTYLACTLVAASAAHATASEPAYQAQLLPVPGTGHFFAVATAINNQGVVGVNSWDADNPIGDTAYLCTPARCNAIPRLHEYPDNPRNWVYALNDAGVATGSSDDLMGGDFTLHAYTFDGTLLSRIAGFDQDGCGGCSLNSVGYGINASGHVAGSAETAKARTRAFYFHDGLMEEVGHLGGHDSQASGINDADDVVGQSEVGGTNDTHAFLYHHGRTKDLGTLGGGYSVARAVNGRGHVVGWSNLVRSGLEVPFLYKKGTMRPLPMPDGAAYAHALALNASDWVVGQFKTADWEDHAFLYDGTAAYDLNDMLSDQDRAHWRVETAVGINALGQIAANGRHLASGVIRAFLFSPAGAAAPR